MKLKGKLAVSFGSLFILTIGVFGLITHYTFTESTRQSAEEILALHTERTNHHILSAIEERTYKIRPQLLLALQNGKTSAEKPALTQVLDSFAKQDPLLNAVSLYPSPQVTRSSTFAKAIDRTILHASSHSDFNKPEHSIFTADNKIYLLWFIPETKKDLLLELDTDSFTYLVSSFIDIEHATLLLSMNGKALLPPISQNSEDKLIENNINIDSLPAGKSKATLTKFGYQYHQEHALLGADITMIVPKEFLFKNLITLKNRIITAILIVGWLSFWTILILANRISTPIKKLSKATQDIIAFNYSSELEINPGNDEIGELSSSFETMRLKIKDLVAKDPLTNVYNRRFLMHIFELAVLKSARMKTDLSLIMIDIDHFKNINDSYGHQCGDNVLVEIGKVLLEETRQYDTPARYGGEEFIFLLPDTDLKTAFKIAERLRLALEEKDIEWKKETIKCTMSMGVSTFDEYDTNSTAKLIGHADAALYEAKENGRNQTIVFNKDKDIA